MFAGEKLNSFRQFGQDPVKLSTPEDCPCRERYMPQATLLTL